MIGWASISSSLLISDDGGIGLDDEQVRVYKNLDNIAIMIVELHRPFL